jgi:hypothetical protein
MAARRLGKKLLPSTVDSAASTVSPLVLDLDGDGVETLGLEAQVHFDHNGDRFAEQTGWAGPRDALLVRDLDHDGRITSGRELFGSRTLLPNGRRAAHGFEALAALDENNDGFIDSSDSAFGELMLWTDANSDGLTDEGELIWVAPRRLPQDDRLSPLETAGILSIDVRYRPSLKVDAQGNSHKQVSRYTSASGSSREVVDVWVKIESSITVELDVLPLPDDVEALPQLGGYGTVRSLSQAMVRDPALKAIVQKFMAASTPESRARLMRDILWRWTGADAHAPDSRGPSISDARWMVMLDAFYGKAFWSDVDSAAQHPTRAEAAKIYQQSQQIFVQMYSRLLSITHVGKAFNLIDVKGDSQTMTFTLNVSSAIDLLVANASEHPEEGMGLIKDFLFALRCNQQVTPAMVKQLKAGLAPLGAKAVALVDAPIPMFLPLLDRKVKGAYPKVSSKQPTPAFRSRPDAL